MTGRADVSCERIRDAASARLDGESIGMSGAALDAHLGRCPACAGWLARSTEVTRTVRIAAVHVPDLTQAVVDQVMRQVGPAVRRRRRRTVVRVLLAVAGVAQLAIAAPDLFGDSLGMAMSMHAAHESAAWNAALGAAFLATAWRPARAGGVIPPLAAFVGLLSVLSVHDLATGAVHLSRLGTHLGCVAGLVLVVALSRLDAGGATDPIRATARADGGGAGDRADGAGGGAAEPPAGRDLRGVA